MARRLNKRVFMSPSPAAVEESPVAVQEPIPAPEQPVAEAYRPSKLPAGRIEKKCSACDLVGTVYVDDPSIYTEDAVKDLFTRRGWQVEPALLCFWCIKARQRQKQQ